MNRIKELDALRGLAAILVVHFHYTMGRMESEYWGILGITGVDLFFMISGFVILLTLEGRNDWKSFLHRRAIRLYPAYWVVVSFTAILIYINLANDLTAKLVELNWEKYFANLSMIQSYMNYGDLDGPYWTLLIEWQFYVLIAITLFIGKGRYILLPAIVLTTFILFLELIYQPLNPKNFREIWDYIARNLQLIGHIPFFLAGMLFYKVHRQGSKWYWIVGIIIAYLAAIMVFDNIGRSKAFIKVPQFLFTTSLYFTLFTLLVKHRLKFLAKPVPLFFGRISYPLYLIHQFMGINLIIPYLGGEYAIHYRQAALIAFGVSVFLAYLITRFIEEPCVRIMKQRFLLKPSIQ